MRSLAALLLTGCLVLASCGGDDDSASASADNAPFCKDMQLYLDQDINEDPDKFLASLETTAPEEFKSTITNLRAILKKQAEQEVQPDDEEAVLALIETIAKEQESADKLMEYAEEACGSLKVNNPGASPEIPITDLLEEKTCSFFDPILDRPGTKNIITAGGLKQHLDATQSDSGLCEKLNTIRVNSNEDTFTIRLRLTEKDKNLATKACEAASAYLYAENNKTKSGKEVTLTVIGTESTTAKEITRVTRSRKKGTCTLLPQ